MASKPILPPAYPLIKKGDDRLYLHGEEIPDPFHRLDNLGDQVTQAWIRSQEALHRLHVDNHTTRNETIQFLTAALNVPQKGIPVQITNDQYLFYYRDAGDDIPKLRMSDTAEGPGKNVLIDPLQAEVPANAGLKTAIVSPNGKLLATSFRLNDSWESPVAIKNLDTGEDLPDSVKAGFVWWDPDSKGFLYNQFSDTDTHSLILRHHQFGQTAAEDPIVWEDKEHRASSAAPVGGNERGHFTWRGTEEWLYPGVNNKPRGLMLKNPVTGGDYRKIFDFGIADYFPITKTNDGILMLTTHDAPNGKIVLFDFNNPSPNNWKTIVAEHKNDALKHAFFQGNRLFALYSHNAADRVGIFAPHGKSLGAIPIPEHSSVQFAHSDFPGLSIWPGNATLAQDDLMMSISNFQQPPTTFRYNISANKLSALDESSLHSPNNLSDRTIVEQLWCQSKDGTKVPMTVIRPKHVTLDGTAALMLSAYGGFGSQASPEQTPDILNFVRSGGIYAFANIRGGGEFGATWHEQGRRLNKQNSFDDFTSCAAFLIDQKYTSAPRLIAEGTSNGGLIVLASMIQKPQLFGAVMANVPVADVLASPHVFYNEYGNPANKADFDIIRSYSPLQSIHTGQSYPPTLIRAAAHDENLIRGALKFVATMQHESPQSTTLLYVEDCDHGLVRPKEIEIREIVNNTAFIERSIGPIDQAKYKQSLVAAPTLDEDALSPLRPKLPGNETALVVPGM